jgi:transcriptional regulator with XRE-family HTH domain
MTVDAANDIAEFLTTRRARITPEQAGLPSYGQRRVPGLRREEVASLAGVSVEYYKRLERGNLAGVSDLVLEGIAGALQLDDAERAHLFDLARAATPAASPRRRRTAQQGVRPNVQRILDQLMAPAIVRNSRVDYLSANALGRALYAPVFDSREQPANSARSRSWTRPPTTSTSTGNAPPRTSSPTCAPRRAATPTTATCPTSSASCPPAAPSSAPGGPPITSATTRPASSDCTTLSSANSNSPTRSWTCRPMQG